VNPAPWQAVACFFPPTDYLNWREAGDDAWAVGVLANFKPAFGPRSDTAESRAVYGKEISPINFVKADNAAERSSFTARRQARAHLSGEIFLKQMRAGRRESPGQTHPQTRSGPWLARDREGCGAVRRLVRWSTFRGLKPNRVLSPPTASRDRRENSSSPWRRTDFSAKRRGVSQSLATKTVGNGRSHVPTKYARAEREVKLIHESGTEEPVIQAATPSHRSRWSPIQSANRPSIDVRSTSAPGETHTCAPSFFQSGHVPSGGGAAGQHDDRGKRSSARSPRRMKATRNRWQ